MASAADAVRQTDQAAAVTKVEILQPSQLAQTLWQLSHVMCTKLQLLTRAHQVAGSAL